MVVFIPLKGYNPVVHLKCKSPLKVFFVVFCFFWYKYCYYSNVHEREVQKMTSNSTILIVLIHLLHVFNDMELSDTFSDQLLEIINLD